MKRTFKALLFIAFAFSINNAKAQNIEGTWVLDSVQVTETMPDSIVQKTVLLGDDSKFSNRWILQFTLDDDRKAKYTTAGGRTASGVPYSTNSDDGSVELYIMEGGAQIALRMQRLTENIMTLNAKHKAGDISASWKMYYHKSNK